MTKKRYAALTMVRDEAFFLPIWHRYYAREFGAENLFIIDHNSQLTPPQTVVPQAKNIFRLPYDTPTIDPVGQDRKTFDHQRFAAISKTMQMLLHYYDCVIYNDADELMFVDDARGLAAYLDDLETIGNRAGVGVEVFEHPTEDQPLDIEKPVLAQRRHFYYRWNICRPCIMSDPTRIGGNGGDGPLWLDADLMMLHLRFVDASQLQYRQKQRLQAFDENRGGQASRWRLSLPETQAFVDKFWQRQAADLELPHHELLDEMLPGYQSKPLCDENYPRFGFAPRQLVKPSHFFDPELTKPFDKFRFVFPERFAAHRS